MSRGVRERHALLATRARSAEAHRGPSLLVDPKLGKLPWLPWLSLLGSLALCSAGCDRCRGVLCGACPPVITLHLQDADTGLAIPGLELHGEAGACADATDGTETVCTLGAHALAAGPYHPLLSAPRYNPRSLEVLIEADTASGRACCSCGFVPKSLHTTLQPSP